MLKKHSILLGALLFVVFLFIAATQYPGGSQHDEAAIGYHWQHNYLSNLLNEKAVNGQDNAARPWAISGVLCFCMSTVVFFYRFSKKLPSQGAANVIVRYTGIGAAVFAPLAATPLHDITMIVSGTLVLLSIFYITVFVFRSKLHLHKVLCILCMLILYGNSIVYSTRIYLEFLPIMQKVSHLIVILWMLSLDYFTKKEDFQKASVPTAG